MKLYLRQAISWDGDSVFSYISMRATSPSYQSLIGWLNDNTRTRAHNIRTALSRFRSRKAWNHSLEMAVGIVYQVGVWKCSWYLMSCSVVAIWGCLLLLQLMIGKRWIWPSMRFLVLSSLSSWGCGPSESRIASPPIVGVHDILAQC